MELALAQSQAALQAGEVPVGAIVVKDGVVIGMGRNAPIASHDPSAHAEIVAIRAAASAIGNYRLDGCDLFVTLEPCAMCAGAMLHARIRRVVFGASDPKTGAAGSVLNLFESSTLNHQTEVVGGVLREPCANILRTFFLHKRVVNRTARSPLRDDALRPGDTAFQDMPEFPWTPRYISTLPVLNGLRLHYLDEGSGESGHVFLCIHGVPGWSYEFQKMLPTWIASGSRVVAPDLIGFGKSDKPKRLHVHSFELHRQCLLQLIEYLKLENITLVVQGWGSLLGVTLPLKNADHYNGILFLNTSQSNVSALNSPFPNAGHRVAADALRPILQDAFVKNMAPQVRQFFCNQWDGKLAWYFEKSISDLESVLTSVLSDLPDTLQLKDAKGVAPGHNDAVANAALQHFAVG